MIVARRSNRCEAPVLPRMFPTSFLEPHGMHIVPLYGALGRWWSLASWQFFSEAVTIQWISLSRPCIRTRVSSRVQPRIPQHQKSDVSYMTHTRPKQVQLPSSINATVPCASLVLCHIHPNIPFALNRNGMQYPLKPCAMWCEFELA